MKPLSRSAAWQRRALLACVVLSLALAAGYRAQAAYVRRYCTVVNGGITFTGNALGLDKRSGENRPGTNGSIGTFITTNTGVRENNNWPYGTTASWTSNSSSAILRLPAGSTVLYAELIWSGSYNYGGELTNPRDLDSPVRFTTPLGGPYDVAPDPATSHTISVSGTNNHNFYVRSQNVTDLVRSAGAGTYTVGRVPGTQATSEDNNNYAGWTLAVIYENQNEPSRSITLFVGGELAYQTNPTTISIVDGFRTAQTGAVHGRLLVVASEGDANISGDQMLFGETEANMSAVSGPNNLVNNFFASQINGEDGNLDTSGTFGNMNHTRSGSGFTLVSGARQGYDITNVDVSSLLRNNQTSAVVQGRTNGDTYFMIAVGLQVDIGAPRFRKDAKRADRGTAAVGEIITYTVDLDNTQGTADAVNIEFRDEMPWGLEFIPGSLRMSGNATMTGMNPEDGVSISQVKLGETVTLTYQARVTAVPIPPAAAEYRNTASWTYQFQSAPILPLHNGQVTTDPCVVTLNINRFNLTKSVSANGNILTYTITATNTGGLDTAGARLTDPIPAGTSYVRNSTYLNGTRISDTGGPPYMPFGNGRAINSPGAPSGVIRVGESAVVTFQVTRTTQNPVTNTATMDPDGTGPLAPLTASVTYPATGSDLAAALTDGQDSAVAGTVVNYTARVTNNGPDATVINGCILSFTPPAGLTGIVFTPAAGSYDEYTGQWTGLSLGPGNYAEMTIRGNLASDATGDIAATINISHLPGPSDPNPTNNTAADIDTVTYEADLTVDKTDGRTAVAKGEGITYTITVTNNGPSTVTSLYVADTIPAELDDAVLATLDGLYNPETHLLSGLRLDPGESATLTLSGTISQSAGSTITNVVKVNPPAGVTDPNMANNEARDIDSILGPPLFRRDAKRADRSATTVGEIITYTVDLDNTMGASDAVDIEFQDIMPWGLEFVPGSLAIDSVPQPGADPETGVHIDRVDRGQIVTLTYQARVVAVPLAPAVAEYRNTASWTYQYRTAPGQPLLNGQVTTDPSVVAVPRLRVTKTVATGSNRRLTYTITVTNEGTAPTAGTTLYDPIPEGTTYRPGTDTTTLNGIIVPNTNNQMPFSVAPPNARAINSPGAEDGVIAAGASAVVIFSVQRPTGSTVATNTAYVDPDGNGGPLPDIIARATNSNAGQANLGVAITDHQTSAVAGAPLTYTVTVSKASGGVSSVNGFILALGLPEGMTQLVYTPARGSYDVNTGRWTGLTLTAGNPVTMTIAGVLSPEAAGSITATAQVSHLPESEITDGNPGDNSAADTDTITFAADLAVDKTDGRLIVRRGEAVTYSITVTNAGPSTITSLYVADAVPGALEHPVFATEEGFYNPLSHLWSGLRLSPGESAVLTLSGTVARSASGTMVNSVTVNPPPGAIDPNAANNTATDTDEIDTTSYLTISGYVYEDADHDAMRDGGEAGTGVAGLYVKILPAAGGSALQAAPVDADTGTYQLTELPEGSYSLILDDNTNLEDTSPSRPAGWLGTEAPNQSRGPLNLTEVSLGGQNFGLWHGAKVTGTVFRDDGAGGGIPHDGQRQAGEAGLGNVRVRAAAGGDEIAAAVTNGNGGYTLWIAAGKAGSIAVAESNPGGYISVAGSAGNTGGSYDRDLDRTIFVCAAGETYTGVNFADVPASTLSPGAVKDVMAGAAVFFPHVFTASTAGDVTFSVDCVSTPAAPLWTTALYLDVDGNGRIDPGEAELTQAQTVTAGEELHLLLKVYAPPGVPPGARAQITLTADLALRNASPPLSLTLSSLDTATAVTPSTAGLTLTKTVDKQTAKPGEELVYTITYTNISGHYLSNLVISDDTPAYTNFVAADFGPLPPQLTACTIDAPPIGGTGSIVWTFAGELAPGASGSVTYRVRIEQ